MYSKSDRACRSKVSDRWSVAIYHRWHEPGAAVIVPFCRLDDENVVSSGLSVRLHYRFASLAVKESCRLIVQPGRQTASLPCVFLIWHMDVRTGGRQPAFCYWYRAFPGTESGKVPKRAIHERPPRGFSPTEFAQNPRGFSATDTEKPQNIAVFAWPVLARSKPID